MKNSSQCISSARYSQVLCCVECVHFLDNPETGNVWSLGVYIWGNLEVSPSEGTRKSETNYLIFAGQYVQISIKYLGNYMCKLLLYCCIADCFRDLRVHLHVAFFSPLKNGFHSTQWKCLHLTLKYV